MSRQKIIFLALLGFYGFLPQAWAAPEVKYLSLNYHDVKDQLDAKDDRSTISIDALVLQFNWLQKQGYTTIGLDDVLAAKEGGKPLPPKAVMLTFDDGYQSFYTRVFPLLKSFKFKAIQAVVGSWIERGNCVPHQHNLNQPLKGVSAEGCQTVETPLMTWDELKEIQSSGLVEIASHTYDLHKGIGANPQGDKLPGATAFKFDMANKKYETLEQYRLRLRADLSKNNQIIAKYLGKSPRIIVWPYSSHHSEAVAVAKSLGMLYNLTLGDASNSVSNINNIVRYLILNSTQMSEFQAILEERARPLDKTVRAMHVDLDFLYDPDPIQQQKNLDTLIERVSQMHANTVFLQAFSDTDGDGSADTLYFPNRYLPVRADLFSHVAWRLKTRVSRLKVYAWMPVMAFHMPEKYSVPLVEATQLNKKGAYHRISPFDNRAREIVKDLYEDLSMHARFDGIIFHDDATFNDYEDASPSAMNMYKTWGMNGSIEKLRSDPLQRYQWAKRKTDFLNRWTLELAASAQRFQETGLLTARNLYALPVLNPDAEEWFAQSLESSLKTYDYTAIMAMPYMEEIPLRDHEAWLISLVKRVESIPGALQRTVFELQAVDWKSKKPIDDEVLARHMFVLHQNAALNLAYYPDDFPANRPNVKILRRYFAWEE
ncbi:MAG: poly-beta-1,6-N-acetyl-D-glucosamine N-deacetylase PgaB [Pseudomonadota bacterium]